MKSHFQKLCNPSSNPRLIHGPRKRLPVLRDTWELHWCVLTPKSLARLGAGDEDKDSSQQRPEIDGLTCEKNI